MIIDLCRKNGVPFRESVLQRHDLYVADEMFPDRQRGGGDPALTTVDRRPVGPGTPGPVTRRLIALFRECVRH